MQKQLVQMREALLNSMKNCVEGKMDETKTKLICQLSDQMNKFFRLEIDFHGFTKLEQLANIVMKADMANPNGRFSVMDEEIFAIRRESIKLKVSDPEKSRELHNRHLNEVNQFYQLRSMAYFSMAQSMIDAGKKWEAR